MLNIVCCKTFRWHKTFISTLEIVSWLFEKSQTHVLRFLFVEDHLFEVLKPHHRQCSNVSISCILLPDLFCPKLYLYVETLFAFILIQVLLSTNDPTQNINVKAPKEGMGSLQLFGWRDRMAKVLQNQFDVGLGSENSKYILPILNIN